MQSNNDAPIDTPADVPGPSPVQNTQPTTQGSGGGLAIAALVVGIVAFISGWVPFWGLVVGIAAVVLGILGIKKPSDKKGLAIAGLVTGGLGALTGVIVTGLAIVGMIGLAAVSSSIEDTVKDIDSKASEQKSAKKDFAKGETALFNNLEVKINSVQRDYTAEYSKPSSGKEFIVINLEVKNTSDKSEYVSPIYYSVNDNGLAAGRSYVSVDNAFESGDLSPGASTSGNIVYEVTKGSTDLKLQHSTTVYTFGEGSEKLVYTLAF